MRQVIKHRDIRLLKMIRRTDPVIHQRWTFTIEGRNMLHTRTYRRLRIESKNDYNEIITENRLPGYIIAGAKYMF